MVASNEDDEFGNSGTLLIRCRLCLEINCIGNISRNYAQLKRFQERTTVGQRILNFFWEQLGQREEGGPVHRPQGTNRKEREGGTKRGMTNISALFDSKETQRKKNNKQLMFKF